ncbi:complement factor H-like [Takifugu flavidus]|uniref:complement factor H-like n=1 Tax=Takifugu flavidus TaxID=433684 RepID=UPI0025441B71|nr:complement factor H-like [Takifugu flavidus]
MLGARLVFGLLWFPGLLNAQKAGRPCQPPKLDDGYFVPQQTTYLHEEQISYACEKGHKKVLGGWWATSKCLDGNWSHNPQCINENDCGPPTILNGKYNKGPMGWYEEGDVIRVTCDPGREHQDRVATAKCINGTWSSIPVCVKSPEACLPPPKIPHGVITDGPYRDLFEVDSSVKYKCEDGYTIKGTTSGDKIFCISGNWTEVPKCTLSCGTRPVVTNGALVQVTTSYLRYQCVRYYKLVGPDTVYCQSSGLWTQLPVCEDNYCYLNTASYPELEDTNHYFLDINEKRDLKCVHQRGWQTEHYSRAYCPSSRIVTFDKCCSWFTPQGLC